MKKGIIVLGIAGIMFAGCGQHISESKLPSVVVNAVKTKYASAEKIEWEKNGDQYEAEFFLNQSETTLLVDSSGNVLMQKQEIKPEELPAAVQTEIAATYKNYTM